MAIRDKKELCNMMSPDRRWGKITFRNLIPGLLPSPAHQNEQALHGMPQQGVTVVAPQAHQNEEAPQAAPPPVVTANL